MVKKLSERQENILTFIKNFLDEHSYPPTVRDIQTGCNVSSTSVVDYNLRKPLGGWIDKVIRLSL